VIEVSNLTKYYGKRLAVDSISFSVEKGEIVGFLGPNAAGKTTTMRIITGFLAPTLGTVKIAGYDVLSHSLEARRHVGYLPEAVPLYADMTIREYLDYMARLRDVPVDKLKTRVNDVIEQCNLEEYTDVMIGRLSKGFRQRVGVAQAIVHEPEVQILDEPTIGIDPIQIASTRQLIRQLGKERTVLISTHILPEVSMTCNRVVIINKGKVVAMDTPEGLARQLKGAERISLTVDGPMEAVCIKIQAIEGVISVQTSESAGGDPATYTVECQLNSDLRRVLASTVVSEGWGLLDLRGISMSLEDVFINLITQE
jgi:ABC-2 type transport system ATP-binding protein